jgi:hypothetical protein
MPIGWRFASALAQGSEPKALVKEGNSELRFPLFIDLDTSGPETLASHLLVQVICWEQREC